MKKNSNIFNKRKSPNDYNRDIVNNYYDHDVKAINEETGEFNQFAPYATYIPPEKDSIKIEAYKEVTSGRTLPTNQNNVFIDRYSLKDKDGNALEKYPEAMWVRVSRALASVENTEELRLEYEKKFYDAMYDFKYIPGGRVLSGAGTGANVTYYNCFVIPSPDDSRTGIIENLKIMVEIMARAGGVGINLSTLRPKGSYIKTVNGHSSGPMAWAQLYSVATGDVISQGGSRRGALMLMLDVSHPDIEEFITSKSRPNWIEHANLSVVISDDFMDAVKNNSDWDLVWNGKVYKTIKASELWDKICSYAWQHAEPGLAFLDRYNKLSNTWYFENIRCTNPCGEQGLGEWQVCNLGSINLSEFVKNGGFDFKELENVTRTAIRLMDNVIDQGYYFFKENKDAQLNARRVGLGTMGLADALIKLGVRYGSDESLDVIEKIYRVIRDTAYSTSSDIALEKGSFPLFDKEKYMQGEFIKQLPKSIQDKIRKNGIRNSVLLTQAPTGATSLLAGVSSGIEPIFSFKYMRHDRIGDYEVIHPLLQEWISLHPDVEDNIPDFFVSSNDLKPEEHVKVQALIQKYTDSSISKTVCAPKSYTVEDVKKLYMLAYDTGCKGITFYREGSIEGAVLEDISKTNKEEKKKVVFKNRSKELNGITYRQETHFGKSYITINSLENGDIYEVFINLGQVGSDVAADATALGRIISLNFQIPTEISNTDIAYKIIKRLDNIKGTGSFGLGHDRITSIADATAKVIKKHIERVKKDNDDSHLSTKEELDLCPKCGNLTLVHEEGCAKCHSCDYSKC